MKRTACHFIYLLLWVFVLFIETRGNRKEFIIREIPASLPKHFVRFRKFSEI